jgi:hypothetical protein
VIAGPGLFSSTRWGRELLDREVQRRVARDGFQAGVPAEQAERCLVNQDVGVRLSRLEEGIEHVQRNLDIHPLWNCPVAAGAGSLTFGVPRKLAAEPETVVDIGVYGEPQVRNYRPYDAVRALQKLADVPSFWGVSYLSWQELRELYDFESYEAVQRKYHAADAFLPLEQKLCFMKPREGAQARPPLWRLARAFSELSR